MPIMPAFIHRFYAMGSDCAVHLHSEADLPLASIASAAEDEIRRIELRYSRYRSDSDLAEINRVAARGGSIVVDFETAGLIDYAFACYARSDGQFDITSGLLRAAWDFSVARLPDQAAIDELLPHVGLDKVTWSQRRLGFTRSGMELDFGGLGKEYAADRAADICLGLGAGHGFIDLGGDIRGIGAQIDGQPWRIGISHPRVPGKAVATVSLAAGAVATSGDYERFIEVDGRRYCHLLNPRTGWPAHGMGSVTVIADRCLVAGTLATTAMLKGQSGGAWLCKLNVRHIVVDDSGKCTGTEQSDNQAE